MPEVDLTNNLIPSGTLTGTLAVGGGTTDYNALENKPSINDVTLSGNKTASDLGLVAASSLATVATTGNFGDLINKPRYTYTFDFGMCTSQQVIDTATYEDFASHLGPITTSIEAGTYTYILFINAKWENASYQFHAGINFDNTLSAASNSFAQAQANSTCMFFGSITVPTTGSHTMKVQLKVSSAGKEVKIMSYTSLMGILIRRT